MADPSVSVSSSNEVSDAPQSESSATVLPTDVEELKQLILTQIEYYFSSENLPKDSFLQSKLDADLYVSIEVIAAFPKLKTLSNSDVSLITAALSASTKLEMDAAKTKIRLRQQPRLTIIIREVASSADEAELTAFLKTKEVEPKTLSKISEDHWYATFDTEQTAIKAIFALRNQEFKGKNLGTCLKHEPIQSVLAWSNPEPFVPQAYPYPYAYGSSSKFSQTNQYPNSSSHPHSHSHSHPRREGREGRDPNRDGRRPKDPNRRPYPQERSEAPGQAKRGGQRKTGPYQGQAPGQGPAQGQGQVQGQGQGQTQGQSVPHYANGSASYAPVSTGGAHPSHKRKGAHDSDRKYNVQVSSSSFPPLKNTPRATYQYSPKDLAETLKATAVTGKPESFVDIPGVTLDSPNLSLLANYDGSDALVLPVAVETSTNPSKISYCQIAAQKN
eukprot:TRINITY_DN486_c0_g1_i1.p1 TRINITY_DN486_c0_g1~~TRINITY_DN486_c0_g1_i1.p1  ORF type:complete len:520 (+),score=190.34 TRINITY_DN486_c0_g1_i1:230-1561(+)